jgi:sugar phosphate isomerase/epimerase
MNDASPRRKPRVGLDHYGLFPLELRPLETLRWAADHGAAGVAFSGFAPDAQAVFSPEALAEMAAFARDHRLYLEWGGAQHIPRDMTTWARQDLFEANRRVAAQAAALGVRVVRSCSGGLMRWQDAAPPTEALLRDTAAALRAQRSMLRDCHVILAIETHFEFTSYELVRLMDLLTMLEDPVPAARRLLPWVVSTHVKDGGILLDTEGLTTFTAPIGRGVVDVGAIVDLVASLDREVHLTVEDHGGSFVLPIFDPLFLSRFPDLTATELARLVGLSQRTAEESLCRPLPRREWPRVCESRTADDLAVLAALVEARASRHD